MSRHSNGDNVPPSVPAFGTTRTSYLVSRREGLWFIIFDREEFGPYNSEREAMLFAIDAAHKLGESGEETQVLRADETGNASPVWTSGIDPYPPAP